jgi:hypothetical protein
MGAREAQSAPQEYVEQSALEFYRTNARIGTPRPLDLAHSGQNVRGSLLVDAILRHTPE